MDSLASLLAEARRRSGLSQADVGALTGQTGSAIGNYERGERVPSTLVLGLLGRALPLDKTAGELQALRKAAVRERQRIARKSTSDDVPPIERELAWFRNLGHALEEQVDQLAAAIAHLESRVTG